MMELIKNSQLNRPLPNANYVKPRLPRIIFNKAERFSEKIKEYEGSMDLFKDGVFGLKTQDNFSNKEPYSNLSKREGINQKTQNSPSPADYKIKSSFEIIAEKGKKISEIREKIRMKENLKNNKNIDVNKEEKEIKLDLGGENKEENIEKNLEDENNLVDDNEDDNL